MDVSFYLNLNYQNNYQYVIVVNKDLFYCLVPKIIHTSPLEILSQKVGAQSGIFRGLGGGVGSNQGTLFRGVWLIFGTEHFIREFQHQ